MFHITKTIEPTGLRTGSESPFNPIMTHSRNTDKRGMAPVVGILLLLSLTVLLGATAATFALGLTDEPTETPTAAFVFDADRSEQTVSIKHLSGDTIEADNLYVVVEGVTCSGGDDPNGQYNIEEDFDLGADEMAAGMTVRYGEDINDPEVCTSGNISIESATMKVVWKPSSTNSVHLQTWTA